MLEALNFVKGSVAKKDLLPELTHFCIENFTIKGFNGHISLCSPIDCNLTVAPKADAFIKAVETCKDTVALSMTDNNRLTVKSGKFKAFIECIESTFPHIQPEGQGVALTTPLLEVFRLLAPFIAQDASRPWATGLLFHGQSAFATNNIIVIEKWLHDVFPITVNFPVAAIKEVLRLKENPVAMQQSDTSLTLHFEESRWLRTNLNSLEWPDVTQILNVQSNPAPVPDNFFEALESLAPFTDDLDRVFFVGDALATSIEKNEGAAVEVIGLPFQGCFQLKQLLSLKGVATQFDFQLYPKPCTFFGDDVRGAIVGIRT